MKKFLSVLLVFTLFLVACGKDDSSKSDTNVIRIALKDESNTNETTVAYFAELEKLFNEEYGYDVKLELVEMPSGSYAESLNLMINSGDIPDLMYFQGGDVAAVDQGVLTDLTPFIENSKYMEDALYEHNKERLDNYPYLAYIRPVSNGVPVISTQLANSLTTYPALVANPTIDNYKAFFSEIVAKGYASAITAAGSLAELDKIFNSAFGINETWVEEDGTYVNVATTEATKNKLAFYTELYQMGLLDKAFLTNAWDVKEDLFYSNQTGVIVGSSPAVLNIYNTKMENVNGTDITLLPPAKSNLGSSYSAVDTSKESRGFAISTQSSLQQETFDLLDFLCSPKGQTLDRLGLEGVHYNVEDGTAVLTEKHTEWFAKFFEVEGVELTYKLEQPLLSDTQQAAIDIMKEYYESDNTILIPNDLSADLDASVNVYNEFAADVVTGKISINEFDAYVENYLANGGSSIAKYINEEK